MKKAGAIANSSSPDEQRGKTRLRLGNSIRNAATAANHQSATGTVVENKQMKAVGVVPPPHMGDNMNVKEFEIEASCEAFDPEYPYGKPKAYGKPKMDGTMERNVLMGVCIPCVLGAVVVVLLYGLGVISFQSSPPPPPPAVVSMSPVTEEVVVETISHSVSMPITPAEFTEMKSSLESGYGLSIGIVDPSTMEYYKGCSVSATARRSLAITFQATVYPSEDVQVNSTEVASALSPAVLVANVQSAVTKANLNVTVPSAASITLEPPAVTTEVIVVPVPTPAPTLPDARTAAPTAMPTAIPSTEPTAAATTTTPTTTTAPTVTPTAPSGAPSPNSASPTPENSSSPTAAPTANPTAVPMQDPTPVPTLQQPTAAPTAPLCEVVMFASMCILPQSNNNQLKRLVEVSHSGQVKPIGRSYEGRDWEVVQQNSKEKIHCVTPVCKLFVPSGLAQNSEYRIDTYDVDTPSNEKLAARFLMQTTFGPTNTTVYQLGEAMASTNVAAAISDWIHNQMAVAPNLHRVRFRERANPRIQGSNFAAGGPRSACAPGSFWQGFAFTEDDVGSQVEVSQAADGMFNLHIDSKLVTQLPGTAEFSSMPSEWLQIGSCTESGKQSDAEGCAAAFDDSDATVWRLNQINVWPQTVPVWIQANFDGPKQISQMWSMQRVRNSRDYSYPWVGDYVDSFKETELLFSDSSKQSITLAPDLSMHRLTPVTTTSVKLTILSVYDEGRTANYHVWRVKTFRFFHHNNAVPFTSKTYEICRVMPCIGCTVMLATPGSCSDAQKAWQNAPQTSGMAVLNNPRVRFPDSLPGDSAANSGNTLIVAANDASFENSIFDLGSMVLKTELPACETHPELMHAKYLTYNGAYYKHDLRLHLPNNTFADPVTKAVSINLLNTTSNHAQETGRFARCPDVPMNPFNRGTCKRSNACVLPLFSSTSITLDASAIQAFYTISDKYVYYITGLRLEDTYAISPCTGTSRWKKLSGNCATNGGETAVDADTKASIADAIANTADQSNLYVRDLVVSGTCNAANGAVSSVGAKIEVAGTCWEHVHPELFNIYDFSYFSQQHDGNAGFIVSKNPIQRWAKAGSAEIQYPSSHPMSRWKSLDGWMQPKLPRLGRFGDTVDFRSIPAEVQTLGMMKHFSATQTLVKGIADSCGSPGEVANDPLKGNHYGYGIGRGTKMYGTTYGGGGSDKRQEIWYSTVMQQGVPLAAQDGLRQRTAWALAQIYVMSGTDGDEEFTEIWGASYDIFVRNAFSNLRDVLRQISYSPMMGRYLTFIGGKSYQNSGSWPDENYSRELMQLFTIGPVLLHANGSTQLDSQGSPIPSYSNDDVMSFARVWTGFQPSNYRGNLEYFHYGNYVDPMKLNSQLHDSFPKANILGGYLGDSYPLCEDFPAQSFLRTGAKFRYLGDKFPRPASFKIPTGGPDLLLSTSSPLYQELCQAQNGNCTFPSEVVLSSKLNCDGIECDLSEMDVFGVPCADCSSTQVLYYQHIPIPCVQMAFYPDGKSIHNQHNSNLCANPKLAAAGASCCTPGNLNPSSSREYNPSEHCEVKWELVTHSKMVERCSAASLSVCKGFTRQGLPTEVKPAFNNCPPRAPLEFGWSPGVWGKCTAADGGPPNTCSYGYDTRPKPTWRGVYYWTGHYQWVDEACQTQVQVHANGMVTIVHSNSASNGYGGFQKDSGIMFKVVWNSATFPTSADGCATGCTVEGSTCLCDTTTAFTPVFTSNTQLPTYQEVKEQLYIASPPFSVFDNGEYTLCSTDACNAHSDVKVYFGSSGVLDIDTVFHVQVHGESSYLLNKVSTVSLGDSQSFRNAPSFHSLTSQSQHGVGLPHGTDAQAENEVFALLDHLLHHPNTPPFIAKRLIQRLVTSNPSPNYIQAVADAFSTGVFSGHTYSGKYGCLAATISAILQHREARSYVIEADPSSGRLREPLMKLLQLLTSLEYKSNDNTRYGTGPREFWPRWLQGKIGQAPFGSPTVFGFYNPEFSPDGSISQAGYVSPESELSNAPTNIAYLNGMVSLIKNGMVDCIHPNLGFGMMDWYGNRDFIGRVCEDGQADGVTSSRNNAGIVTFTPSSWNDPTSVVAELDLVLTGGRLNDRTAAVIAAAYVKKRDEVSSCAVNANVYPPCPKALQQAEIMMIASVEFQSTNQNRLTSIPRLEPPVIQTQNRPYKAVVLIHLNGGSDSWNMLMPHSGCTGDDLYDIYAAARGQGAYTKAKMLQINVPSNQQNCSTFGLNPKLSGVKTLYDAGDLAFIINAGPMIEPMTKHEYHKKLKRLPYGLFGHAGQQEDAKNVHAGLGSTAKGILGRLSQAMGSQTQPFSTHMYSMAGNQKSTEGWERHSPDILANTVEGVVRFKYNSLYANDINEMMSENQTSSIFGETFGAAMKGSLNRTESLGHILDPITTSSLPNSGYTSIQGQLRHVTRVIKARSTLNSERDAFMVEMHGWDTHFDRFDSVEQNYKSLSDAVNQFSSEMKAENIWDGVTVVITSDFGRTMSPNSAGTDHGWGGNYFVAGGEIKDQAVLGEYPDVSEGSDTDLGRGRQLPSRSWESIWYAVAQWFGVEAGQMKEVLPNLENFPGGWVWTKEQLYDSARRSLETDRRETLEEYFY